MRILLLALSLLCCGAAFAKTDEAAIVAHQRANLTVGAEKGREQHLLLEAGSRSYALTLTPNDALVAQVDAGTRASILGSDNRFLAGSIDGVPGSWARLSRVAGQWSGAIYDGTDLVLIDPVAQVRGKLKATVATGTELVAYKLSDVYLPDRVDGIVSPMSYSSLVAPKAADVATKQLDLSIITDGDFSTVHGGNASAVVASRINTVDGIYSAQLSVHVAVSNLTILASNGTLTSTAPTTLLEQFRVLVAGGQLVRGDLTHLMSGKDFDGSTVGIAYVSVLCHMTHGVGVNQVRDASQTTALTMAHELGHDFGAPHDGEGACTGVTTPGIMNPSLNGSTTFSSCSITQMTDDIAGAACLGPVTGGAAPVLFANGFE